jgi:glycosyltransferase involved in cell wall biosynthesis
VTPEEAALLEVDLVIIQRPAELDGLVVQWLGRRPGTDIPCVYLEHNTPEGPINAMRHPAYGRPDLLLVHVTHFNALFWDAGSTPTAVIEHGIVDPGYRYDGHLQRAVVVVNEPIRRDRVVGRDLIDRVGSQIPFDLFGMQSEDLGGVDLIQADLHNAMAQRRVYFHPFRWTSLGLALIEAMHLGLPVVSLATTEAAEAVSPDAGVVSNRPDVLERALREFLHDPDRARAYGHQARKVGLARYGLRRFLTDWDRLLGGVTT